MRVSTSADQTAILERFIETGTYRVTVNYSLNGETASAFVDVNVVMPTPSSFVGTQVRDRVRTRSQCLTPLPYSAYPHYTLGCLRTDVNNDPGITFRAKVVIPNGTYLSDPVQGGVKYVQKVSAFRKKYSLGTISCLTARNHDLYTTRRNDSDETTGWQQDGEDPLYGMFQRFSLRAMNSIRPQMTRPTSIWANCSMRTTSTLNTAWPTPSIPTTSSRPT